MGRYDDLLSGLGSGFDYSTTLPTYPSSSGTERYADLLDFSSVPPEKPGFGSRVLEGISTVVGAPKHAIDWLAQQGAEKLYGMKQPEGATTGSMLRAAGLPGITPGFSPGADYRSEGYGGKLGGRAIEFATDLGTDPLTYATAGLGKTVSTGAQASRILEGAGPEMVPWIAEHLKDVARAGELAAPIHKGASIGFTGLMGVGALQEGQRAIDTLRHEGFTPQAAEEALGATLSAGGAAAGALHLAAERKAAKLEAERRAATRGSQEPTEPSPEQPQGGEPEQPQAPNVWEGETPQGFEPLSEGRTPEEVRLDQILETQRQAEAQQARQAAEAEQAAEAQRAPEVWRDQPPSEFAPKPPEIELEPSPLPGTWVGEAPPGFEVPGETRTPQEVQLDSIEARLREQAARAAAEREQAPTPAVGVRTPSPGTPEIEVSPAPPPPAPVAAALQPDLTTTQPIPIGATQPIQVPPVARSLEDLPPSVRETAWALADEHAKYAAAGRAPDAALTEAVRAAGLEPYAGLIRDAAAKRLAARGGAAVPAAPAPPAPPVAGPTVRERVKALGRPEPRPASQETVASIAQPPRPPAPAELTLEPQAAPEGPSGTRPRSVGTPPTAPTQRELPLDREVELAGTPFPGERAPKTRGGPPRPAARPMADISDATLAKRLERARAENDYDGFRILKAEQDYRAANPPAQPKPKRQGTPRLKELPKDPMGSPIIPGQEGLTPERRAAERAAAEDYAKGVEHEIGAAAQMPGMPGPLRNTPLHGLGSPKQILEALKRDKGNALERRILGALADDPRAAEYARLLREDPEGFLKARQEGRDPLQRPEPSDIVPPEGEADTSFSKLSVGPKEPESPALTDLFAKMRELRGEGVPGFAGYAVLPKGTGHLGETRVAQGVRTSRLNVEEALREARARVDVSRLPAEQVDRLVAERAATDLVDAAIHEAAHGPEGGHTPAFDAREADMRRALGPELLAQTKRALATELRKSPKFSVQDKLGFYSPLQRIAERIPQAMRGSQMYQYLIDPKRSPGVAIREEAKWTGLDDFLRERADKRVTPQEVQEFLKANDVQVQQVQLGGPPPKPENPRIDIVPDHKGGTKGFWAYVNDEQISAEPFPTEQAARAAAADFRSWGLRSLGQPPMGQKTKFGQWQLPGGENYREVLLTLPEKPYADALTITNRAAELARADGFDPKAMGSVLREQYREQAKKELGRPGFRGGHFDEPNVLAHIRLNDRTDAQGKRVLFVEEIQSDWAQKGRREGFAGPGDKDAAALARQQQASTIARLVAVSPELEPFSEGSERFDLPSRAETFAEHARGLAPEQRTELRFLAGELRGFFADERRARPDAGPPSAPFVTSTEGWTNLALKRVLRMAAEEGYDRVAWTTGEQQAARYDLSKQIKRISFEKRGDKTALWVEDKGGNMLQDMIAERHGEFDDTSKAAVVPNTELPEIVGKEHADRILANPEDKGQFTGLDLKVGGEGMAGFYDKILPAAMGKLGKKWGAKVGETTIDTASTEMRTRRGGESFRYEMYTKLPSGRGGDATEYWINDTQTGTKLGPYLDADVRQREFNKLEFGDTQPKVHSIDITPEMRRSVTTEGQPRFAPGEPGAPAPPDRAVVREKLQQLFKGQRIADTPEGFFEVRTPNGTRVLVLPTGEITFSPAAKAAAERHGPGAVEAVETGRMRILGATNSFGPEVMVRIVDAGQLPHEVGGHVFLDHFASEKERAFVLKEWTKRAEREGSGRDFEEVFADDYQRWWNDRKSAPSTVLGSIFERMHAFFLRLARGLGLQTRGGLFREIESGKAWARGAAEGRPIKPIPPGAKPGQPALTARDQTTTPEFKRWFGASKVVDEQGQPKVVYHRGEFDETVDPVPDINGEGFHFGTKDAADMRPVGKMVDDAIRSLKYEQDENGRWHWRRESDGLDSFDMGNEEGFSTREDAVRDAEQVAVDEGDNYMGDGEEPALTAAYITLKNPKRVPDQMGSWGPAIAKAKAEGHDGIVYRNQVEDKGSLSYIAFEPTQIKSVKNRGTFDPTNPDVRLATGPAKLSVSPAPAEPPPGPEPAPEAPPEALEAPRTRVTGFPKGSPEAAKLEPSSVSQPRVEAKVEELRRQERLAGIDVQKLARDQDRRWKTLDPKIQRILRTQSDETLLGKAARGHVNDAEMMALDARARDATDRANAAAEAYRTAQSTGGDTAAANAAVLRTALDAAVLQAAKTIRVDVDAGSKIARALAARARVMQAGTSVSDSFLRQVFREIPGITDEQAGTLLKVMQTDPTRLQDALQSAMKPTTLNKWVFAWKNGLVSAPGTQVANIAGNVGEFGMRVGETGVAALLDSLFKGQRTRYVGELGAELRGAVGRLPTALRELGDELKATARLAPEKIRLDQAFEHQVNPIGGKLGRAIGVPFRLLGTFDDFNKALAGDAELGKLAYRKAAGELGKDASHAAITARMQEIVKEALDLNSDKHQDLFEAMQTAKQERTFQKAPGALAKSLMQMRSQHPWMHALLPFLQTPANIMDLTIERSPAGFLKAKRAYSAWRAAERAGADPATILKFRGEAMDAMARPLLGTSIIAGFLGMAKMGMMTGSGPTDTDERNLLRQTGWQPYSFKLGDKYVPYNRFEPVSSLLGFAADLAEVQDEKKAGDVFDKALGSVVQNLTNKTYLSALADAAALYKDPMQFGSNYVRSLVGSAVPNIVAKAATAIDPTVRDVKPTTTGPMGIVQGLGKTIASRIPGASMALEAKESGTGEPAVRPGTAAERFLLPSVVSEQKPGTELESLMVKLGIAPSQPSRTFTRGGKKLQLSDVEYDLLQEGNRMAADRARRLIALPSFQRLDEEEQARQLRMIFDRARDMQRDRLLGQRDFRRRFLTEAQ